jgi:hypothetical protein
MNLYTAVFAVESGSLATLETISFLHRGDFMQNIVGRYAAVVGLSLGALLAMMGGGCSRCPEKTAEGKTEEGGAVVAANTEALTEKQILASKHPLVPAWKLARDALAHIEKDIHDYTATLVSRERFPEKSEPYADRTIFVKIRHKPFSAYFRPLEPEKEKGSEAIYVEGKNDGNAVVHTTGVTNWALGNLSLDPKGKILMRDQHYPMTEVGFQNLTRRLMEQAAKDMRYDDCKVTFSEDAKIDGRPCRCVRVVHSKRRKEFIFHEAKIYIDKEWFVPVCYEAFDWPAAPGEKPVLLERFEYRNMKINPGLTDFDFDIKNPEYKYSK